MIPSGCRVHLPVASPTSTAFPKRLEWVGFPESFRKETSCGFCFEIVAISYVQGRGRDNSYPLPPAQSRAGTASAHGSYLGCLASKRTFG